MKPFDQLRIVFFGTPDFAVASLNTLVEAGANVVAVVTMPDKPAGRGQQIQISPVKKYAVSKGLPLMQPEKMKAPAFIDELKSYEADLQIVVAFRMMPEVVWNMPPMGTINVHGSLLPQYRGAAPINWAIINGDPETGVTTFKLKHEIDTGDILLQQKVAILPKDDAGSMHDKLMYAGAGLLLKTVKGLADGILKEAPQPVIPDEFLKHAPKLFKETLVIDWTKDAKAVNDFIRGLSPYPAACTTLGDKQLKIYKTHYTQETFSAAPGSADTDNSSYMRFAARDGWVYADEVQIEGKKRMKVGDFLRGYRK
jgi:methionyl-tRNA formyltransferase